MRRDHWLRVLLGILIVSSLLTGAWAEIAPRAFYMNFPTTGLHWVASGGPYDQHLVRDVGSLNLALATMAVVAFIRLDMNTVRVVAGGFFVFSAVHVAYHLESPLTSNASQFLQVVALFVPVVVALFILLLRWPRSLQHSIREAHRRPGRQGFEL